MPYQSKAQQGFFHTQTAQDQGITPQMTQEFDQSSKGQTNLPVHVTSASNKPARQKLAAKMAEMSKGK